MNEASEIKKLMESIDSVYEAVDSVDMERLEEAIFMLKEAAAGVNNSFVLKRIVNDPKLDDEVYHAKLLESMHFVTGYLRTL